jgi:ABC-2 type transport system ATP-binding protein
MDEAERLCDRVAVIDKGKVVALGSPAELIAGLGGQEVIEFAPEEGAPLDEKALAALPGVHAARPAPGTSDGGFTLSVGEVHVAVPALLGLLGARCMKRLSTRHATLEDVFVHLTGRQLRD